MVVRKGLTLVRYYINSGTHLKETILNCEKKANTQKDPPQRGGLT